MNAYRLRELDNGLKVVGCKMPGMESASIGIWIGMGGRYETKKMQGVSHFIEHLLFKGTKKRSAVQISRAIEGVGGHINAFTSEECTCFMVKVRRKHQALACDVLWDMIINPLFNKGEIDKERLVVKEEINMIMDYPAHHVSEAVQELMWPQHPLGRMLIGTVDTIDSMKRKDIIDIQKKNYFPRNMVVSAAGNIDVEELISESENYSRGLVNSKKPKVNIFKAGQKAPKLKIIPKSTEQIHICMGMRSVPKEDPDKNAVKLLSTILGGNMSSRLFQIIREKYGLAYDIHSSTQYFKDTGGFIVSGGVKVHKINKFVELVLKELKDIKKNSVKRSELARVKEFYEGQLSLGFEKTMTKMIWMGEHLLTTDKVPNVDDVISDVQKVTLDDINRVADKIFRRNNLNIGIIGPIKEDVKFDLGL